jgi:VCBS repeat-containing protein
VPEFDALRYIASYADLIRAFGADAELGRRHWETSGKSEGRDPNRFDPIAYAAANPDLARLYHFDATQLTLHYLKSGFAAGRPTSGFDAIAYAAANPDLARVFGADVARLTTHWVGTGVDEGRPAMGFNALGYAAANPAVARQFGVDAKALALHYVSDGARAGLKIGVFDPLAYGAANPDLARQFGADSAALTNHFISIGAKAGLPTGGFDPIAYAAANPDLARAFGASPASLTLHWLGSGADEGRATSGFDFLSYAAANPQLARTYGANGSALALHYVTEGARAGLKTSGFDAIAYAAANPDLVRAFGANVPALLTHYVTRGVQEGRATGGFDAIAYAAANPDLARLYGADAQALAAHYVATGLKAGLKTSGFDALGYAWANPAVGRDLGLDPTALARHFVIEGARAGLKTAIFDPIAYAAANPDLARAFGGDAVQLKDHFVSAGFAEGRPIAGFDALAYAAANPDLVRSHGWNPGALTTHFVTVGAAAGRPTAGFDAYNYGAANPDLARLYGADVSALSLHWVTRGIGEGRATSGFDTVAYAAANAEAVREVGLDPAALARHYVEKGLAAGLPTGGFDPVAYLLSNSDLGASGVGVASAFGHWLANGIQEGRSGDSLFGREQQSHALAVDGHAAGRFDTPSDRDWYGVELAAGQSYAFVLDGMEAPLDAQIRIHEAPGQLLAFLNPSGAAAETVLAFTAASSGTHYVALAAAGAAGDYLLTVAPAPILDEDGAVATAAGDLLADADGLSLSAIGGIAVPDDGSPVTVAGLYGTLTVAGDGAWTYELDNSDPDTERLLAGEIAAERFDYLTTGGGESAAETLRLFVRGAADPGVADVPLGAPVTIGTFPRQFLMPAVADFDGDGWLEPFGFLSDRAGGFVRNPAVDAALAAWPGRSNRDARIFDLDGDGNVDAMLNVYSAVTDPLSFGLVLYGDGAGGFDRAVERRDVNGFGETILAADFDNDGDLDVFVPVYTHAGTSPSTHLLFNENGLLGENRAVEFGVGLAEQPPSLRVEGAQALDMDFDGRIDLFTASHLFLNKGMHFDEIVLDPQRFDEGAKLFDYDNDGDFDLVLMDEHAGPALYEWSGGRFVSRGQLGSGDFTPGVSINVYDVDGNGWEDVVTRNVPLGAAMFLNFEGRFVRADIAADFHIDALAFFDADKDRRIDMLARADQAAFALFPNVGEGGSTLALNVLGSGGEENQQGRVVTLVHPDHPETVLARAVESGSGYMNQNQYELLIGLPYGGSYRVEVVFADRRLAFEAGEGHSARAFADGHVEIAGSDGADRIGGAGGADIVSAGLGDDLILGTEGADALDGGEGTDRIDYSAFSAGIELDLAAGTALLGSDLQMLAAFEDATGTAFNDVLAGGTGANRIAGGGGDDLLIGSVGADALDGGEGRDRVDYSGFAFGVRVDLAAGEAQLGDDLQQLAAIEEVTGTGQDDLIAGDDDANRLDGGEGADDVAGGGGDDLIVGSAGADTLDGGDGVDRLDYSGLASGVRVDLAAGSAQVGADTQAIAGMEDVTGTAFADSLRGDPGANRLAAGGGDDVLMASLGEDELDGGEGSDLLDLSELALAATVDLANGFARVGSDLQHVLGLEDVIGTDFDDVLSGDSSANRLAGGTGADKLEGRGGDDLFMGSTGADVIDGGEGIDRLDYSGLDGGVKVDLAAGNAQVGADEQSVTGIEEVVGTAQDDILGGSAGADRIDAGEGEDWVLGSAGADALDGGDGDDILDYSGLGAGIVVDLAAGEAIVGGETQTLAGFEQVTGTSFADELTGDARRNGLAGGEGDDRLAGGGGGDVLEGGAGADLFLFIASDDSGGQPDLIADFSQSDGDRIDFSALAAGGVAFQFVGDAAFSGSAGEVRAVVDEAAGSTAVFADLDGDATADIHILLAGPIVLTASDFQF